MSEPLTPERLAEMRRIAEAATPGPWERDERIVYALTHYGYRNGIEQRANKVTISVQKGHDCSAEEADAVALHIATFDPPTVFALLDEIARLRREREVLAEVLRHVHTCENCECALCPEGAELSYRAYRALGEAMDLLDGEEIVDNVTRFALYHPDLNVWECQAKDCRFQWEFMEDGNPYEHGMRFCPRCGRRIVRGTQQKHS